MGLEELRQGDTFKFFEGSPDLWLVEYIFDRVRWGDGDVYIVDPLLVCCVKLDDNEEKTEIRILQKSNCHWVKKTR